MGTAIKFQLLKTSIISVLLFFYGCAGYKPAYLKMKNEYGKNVYKNRESFLREYALCSCLSQVYAKDSLKYKDGSNSSYYDFSDEELRTANTGNKIDSVVDSFLNYRKNNLTNLSEGRPRLILDCITYAKSKELGIKLKTIIGELKSELSKKPE